MILYTNSYQKIYRIFAFFSILFIFFGKNVFSQYPDKIKKEENKKKDKKGYTDYKPTYTQWQRQYILDKIEYRPQRTVFYFRYLGDAPRKSIFGDNMVYGSTTLSLFGGGRDSSWCIANPYNPRENFPMIEVRNVRRNGVLVYERLEDRQILDFVLKAKEYEVVTCEIHFPKLPNDIKTADLLEGWRYKALSNHFHCLNIQLKTEDEDIGTYQDMVTRINQFETRYFGWARSEQAQILPPEFPDQPQPERKPFKLPDELQDKTEKKEEKIVKKEEKKKEEPKKKPRPTEAQAQVRDEIFLSKK